MSKPHSDPPETWHHGLMARWWAEFNRDGDDIAWFQRLVEQSGEPALDLGCGTGRLLVPFLHAGLDVDGCDISLDMLSHCRARAEAEGFAPRLLHQSMQEFDGARAYRTIYSCGSFGIGGTRAHDLATLVRAHRHLVPGGALVFDIELPNFEPRGWQHWLPTARPELPTRWHSRGDRRRAADGSEIEINGRFLAFDPLEQTAVREMRARHWQGEELLAEEQYSLRINIYFKNEVLLMLALAGFSRVAVQGDATGREAAAYEDGRLMFVATK